MADHQSGPDGSLDDVRTDGPQLDEAVARARAVMAHAHAPYSRFHVGAAVLVEGGVVHVGCNVESASYGLTQCAERTAIATMIAATAPDARRPVTVVAIVTEAVDPTPPCGACRQWLAEFAPQAVVVSEGADGARARWSVAELLPSAFTGEALDRE